MFSSNKSITPMQPQSEFQVDFKRSSIKSDRQNSLERKTIKVQVDFRNKEYDRVIKWEIL